MRVAFLTFTLRRLVAAVLVALGVSAITFVMLHVLRPEAFSDPRPLPVQLGDFLWGAATQFDLGRSRQAPGRPVGEMVLHGLPADLSLFAGALVFGVAAGVAGGVACARRPRSLLARLLRVLALLALCAPVYWVGLLVLLLFGSGVGAVMPLWLVQIGNYEPLTQDPLTWLHSLLVPWIVTGAPLAAICLRMTAATLRDIADEDFLRTALGKGLSERAAMVRHALPVSVAPTVWSPAPMCRCWSGTRCWSSRCSTCRAPSAPPPWRSHRATSSCSRGS